MRVLLNAATGPSHPRGIGRYVRELSRALAAIGDLELIVAHAHWHEWFFAPLADCGVELVSVALPRSRALRPAWHALGLRSLAGAMNADVVHIADRLPPPVRAGTPLVVTIHDVAEYDLPEAFGPVQQRYRRLVLRRQLRAATRLITPSQFSADRLAVIHPSAATRTTVVPSGPGIDATVTPQRPPAQVPDRFFLAIGATQRHKNLGRLVSAFRNLDDESIGLVLAGADENDAYATYRAIAGDPRIVRLRDVNDAHVAWLYNHAIGLVFPSLYEGFGLPVLEAMAFGCPVITSDRGAPGETAGAAAIRVDPTDVHALSEAMARLGSDAELRLELAQSGRVRATAFSWAAAAAATAGVYRASVSR